LWRFTPSSRPHSNDAKAELDKLAVGTKVTVPDVLFKKIEDEQIAEWTARFGGAE
jgi:methionyl-tRNA synthetase